MSINDRDSALVWAEGKPREVLVAFAARCALRALPGIATADRATLGRIALPVLRATLTSGVAAVGASRALMRAAIRSRDNTADAVADASDSQATIGGNRASVAVSAAIAANRAAAAAAGVHPTAAPDAADTAARATRAASASYAASSADADSMDAGESPALLFQYRLWRAAGMPEELAGAHNDLIAFWNSDGRTWGFWAGWYERMLRGDPLPWDLQEQIALIPDQIWEAGPATVAAEIERIEAEFELRESIADFEADHALVEKGRLGIGGNNPPEEIDDPDTREQVTLLWESIAGLKAEVEAEKPDADRVATLINSLGAALKAIFAWCARKGDLMVDTAIKWVIPAGGGYLILNPAKAEAVLKAAQAWLPFLAP